MGKRFSFLLISILALSLAAFAQTGSVTGTVLDHPNGSGAAGATVTMHRNMHGADSVVTTTDAEGHFAFDNIASGGWGAMVTLEEYLPGFGMVFVPWDGGTVDVILVLGPPLGETGAVAGTVLTAEGEAAVGATVLLDMQMWHHPGFHAQAVTDAAGAFAFDAVPAGNYGVSAMLFGEGFANAQIEVLPEQTTNVTLTLEENHGGHHGGGHHGGGHPCDSLVVTDLVGTAMVVAPDSGHHQAHYFLDVDADGVADYRLAFGPWWYNPPSGAERPADGDEITIHGGLLSYGEPQIVVVFEINGMFWREPCHHGGHGGWHGNGCDPDSIEAIELEGAAVVQENGGFHGDMHRYGIDVDADGVVDYRLSFGPPWYDPDGIGQGAERPANGDQITIVGGLMQCDSMELGVVIVYEINGLPWRDPGDTTGFSPAGLSASDPVDLGIPASYLTATNYPNPFNPATTITYALPTNGNVSMKVFDIVGREVATLVKGYQSAGTYMVNWDASDLPSGIYLYRVTVGSLSFTNRMVLIK